MYMLGEEQRHTVTHQTLQGGSQKVGTFLYALQLCQIMSNFQTFFTVRIRRKFVIIPSQKISSHLECVATLPCEMSVFLKQQLKTRRHILRVCRLVARQTHQTFDVKTAGCDSYFRQ